MDDRILSLEGIDNFRDFGGYATADGRRVRAGRLYRSAHHGQATDADLAAIAALDIAVIVDLRRGEERQRTPSRRHGGFAARLIENDGNEASSDPFVEFIRTSDVSEAAFRDYMLGYYRGAPFDERHLDLFSRYFQALAQDEGAVLIHCTAGKDRTGLLAALTHHVAGVHRDDIFDDYLLTNTVASFERRLPAVAQMIVEVSGRTPTDAAVRTAVSVDAAYLEGAFAVIEARNGSIDAYLEDALGVDAALRAQVEARLVR
jgi:protein tyrosine/serine phosphatase